MPWAAAPPAGGEDKDDANYDEMETPVVLSARLEAVKILLGTEGVGVGVGVGGERAVVVGDDDERERECWLLLLEAREAYVRWVAVCRAGKEEEEEEEAVRKAADKAMEALEGVLTFEVCWMGNWKIDGRIEEGAGCVLLLMAASAGVLKVSATIRQ